MTIGELIKQYLRQTGQSYQQLADKCHVSKAYISLLVNGRNPKTGKPIRPTIETYSDIAAAMGMSIDELFATIDDAPVTLKRSSTDTWAAREALMRDPARRTLLELAERGTAKDVQQVAALIDALKATNPDFGGDDD